jgi:hypothetical protein
MADANPDFDTILATTLKNYAPTLEDNVFNARALLNWLKRKDRVRTKRGGATCVVPIVYAENDTVSSYAGYDTLDTTPQDGISAAEYPWRQYAGSVAISGIEEAKNAGEEEVVDLLEAKIMQTEESISEGFNAMFYADGSGNSSKDWNGLRNLINDNTYDSAAYASLGGIDSATYTFWQSIVNDLNSVPLTLGQLSSTHNNIHQGTNDKPDFHITTDTLWEKYESLLQPSQRFSDAKTAAAGFENLIYKGAPVVFDIDATAGEWYMLNSKYLTLYRLGANWMRSTPFRTPVNGDAKYSQIISYGQLAVNRRRRLGKIVEATA